jgi:hypothetical protein
MSFAWCSIVFVWSLIFQPYGSYLFEAEQKQFIGILLAGPVLLLKVYSLTLSTEKDRQEK